MTQQEKKPRGLPVIIYHCPLGDYTNGGASSKYDRAILIGEGLPELSEAYDGEPVFTLVKRDLFGQEYLHVEPIKTEANKGKWYMFGGNFCHTSDSRFPNRYPLAIHDRTES